MEAVGLASDKAGMKQCAPGNKVGRQTRYDEDTRAGDESVYSSLPQGRCESTNGRNAVPGSSHDATSNQRCLLHGGTKPLLRLPALGAGRPLEEG
jgi:hypothetical protein